MDPLTKQYACYSPYHFAGNRPIMAIDLDGKEPDDVVGFMRARDAEAESYKTDPVHAEERIHEYKKNAFLIVVSMLTPGHGTLFSLFTDAVGLYGGYKFGKGLVKKDAKSVQEGVHLMVGAAAGEMGGLL